MAQSTVEETSRSDWLIQWDVRKTITWIESNCFKRVTLQFPDELLAESTLVAAALQQECVTRHISTQVSVLADTSYNSLSVDEVAAQHAQADCVIHYGRASMSPLSRLPAYFVFGQQHLDTRDCAERLAQYAADKAGTSNHAALLVFLDQVLLHAVQDVQKQLKDIQQNFSNTLHVIFADVGAHSMQPASPEPTTSSPQAAACACRAAATSNSSEVPSEAANPPGSSGTGHSAGQAQQAQQAQQSPALPSPHQQPAHSLTPPLPSSSHPSTTDATDGSNQRPIVSSDACLATASSEDRGQEVGRVAGHIAGYRWQLPAGLTQDECIMLWVGPDTVPTLTHLHLTFNKLLWVMYDPDLEKWQEGLPLDINKTLKRRYYLVEKAKNASVIGILVGTLGVAGYQNAIESIRRLAKQAGKKTYTMLMGKPNPAKLANFPEVEIFVMVADPQGMILDSKEYFAAIITPYEAYLAFSGDAEWTGDYSLDFSSLQGNSGQRGGGSGSQQPRLSLLDGSYHTSSDQNGLAGDTDDASSTALACRAEQALQLTGSAVVRSKLVTNDTDAAETVWSEVQEFYTQQGKDLQVGSASEYLQKRRTYHGLEAPIVGAESKPVIKAVQGQSGRASQYQHEPSG